MKLLQKLKFFEFQTSFSHKKYFLTLKLSHNLELYEFQTSFSHKIIFLVRAPALGRSDGGRGFEIARHEGDDQEFRRRSRRHEDVAGEDGQGSGAGL